MKALAAVLRLAVAGALSAGTVDAQWFQQNAGTNEQLTGVAMLDSAVAIAVGRGRSILRTSDAGDTWVNLTAPLSSVMPWNCVSFFDASHGIVAGDQGGVMMTVDGGMHWIQRAVPGAGNCLSALCAGPGRMYVGDDSGNVFYTSDTGSTWSAMKISVWPIRSLFEYRGPTVWGPRRYGLTPYSLCTQAALLPSDWNESILPHFQGLGSEAFAGESCYGGGPMFVVGVQGDLRAAPAIVRWGVSDTVWHIVSQGILRDGALLAVSAPSSEVIYACGTRGMLFRSSDGGDNWIDQSRQTIRSLNAVCFVDGKHGFAVGDSGFVLHTSNGGLATTDVDVGSPQKTIVLEQNYPNPFNPRTTIRYGLPSRSHVTLTVFNTLGQLVKVLQDGGREAGYHEVKFDAGALASGVYLYRMQVGSSVESKKFLLVK